MDDLLHGCMLFTFTILDDIKGFQHRDYLTIIEMYGIIIVTIINKGVERMSETKLRYSKQRETIYDVLKNDWYPSLVWMIFIHKSNN